jgi:methyl-accepting chemotaxis protein
MPEFKYALSLSQFAIPLICFGMLFMGMFIFAYIYYFVRDRLYFTMMVLALTGAAFVFSETMILLLGGWMLDPAVGMQFHRIEQLAAGFFFFAIPYLLMNLLVMGPRWHSFNRALVWTGLALALGFAALAFIAPELYVSVTEHRADWLIRQADHGRGTQGPAYLVRDAVLFFFIIYAVVCFIIDMARNRRLRYLMPSFIGLMLAIHGAVVDIISTHTFELSFMFDLFPNSRHSRFVVGITLFILCSMVGVLRRFLDLARSTEIANERAQKEAEKNRSQNLFIRDVLKKNSESLVGHTESLSSGMEEFTDNTREQAASTEEISASIEEILAGVESVKRSADDQYAGIERLAQALAELGGSASQLGDTVGRSLSTIHQISSNAKSGEESLRVMNESMQTISGSSAEITGIVEIINDISDRINLLALNAAIEAARAGEAGRGFAVVADEIGKLADATAGSIKSINTLIKNNEQEIGSGMRNITVAVSRINAIMKDIDGIVAMISEISGQAGRQASANKIVEESAAMVKGRAEQITRAMNEQNLAVSEISRGVGSINELSQNNTLRIQAIADSARALVEMMSGLRNEIDEFGRSMGAQRDGTSEIQGAD